jgi:hypothetical protein
MISANVTIILITLIFQFGTKHWTYIAIWIIILCLIGTIYVIIFVPESV